MKSVTNLHDDERAIAVDPPFVVEGGATFEVDDDLAVSLLDQPSNWAPGDDETAAWLAEVVAWDEAVRDAEADAEDVGIEVAEGDTAVVTGDGSGEALPPFDPDDQAPKEAPARRRRASTTSKDGEA